MGNTKSSARKRIKELEDLKRIKDLEDELIKYPDKDHPNWKGRAQWAAKEELDNLLVTHLSLEENYKSQLRTTIDKEYIESLKNGLAKI